MAVATGLQWQSGGGWKRATEKAIPAPKPAKTTRGLGRGRGRKTFLDPASVSGPRSPAQCLVSGGHQRNYRSYQLSVHLQSCGFPGQGKRMFDQEAGYGPGAKLDG